MICIHEHAENYPQSLNNDIGAKIETRLGVRKVTNKILFNKVDYF